MDALIKKNVEKANKKRGKKGLPPQKVTTTASYNTKSIAENRIEHIGFCSLLSFTLCILVINFVLSHCVTPAKIGINSAGVRAIPGDSARFTPNIVFI